MYVFYFLSTYQFTMSATFFKCIYILFYSIISQGVAGIMQREGGLSIN